MLSWGSFVGPSRSDNRVHSHTTVRTSAGDARRLDARNRVHHCLDAVAQAPRARKTKRPLLPWWFERICLLAAGVWFVNLVNFMDGIDWMMVAETVPLTAAMVGLGLLGAVDTVSAAVAAALCGAMLGFALFNRPPAKLFLGDVGSLPIGLILGFLLLNLA